MTTRFALFKVAAAHGINGELKCYPLVDDESKLTLPVRCFTAPDADTSEPACDLVSMRPAGTFRLLRLAGVNDRTTAETFKGKTLYADRTAVPPPAEGTWFLADLIGLTVRVQGAEDQALGYIREIAYKPSQDLLVIAKSGEADVLLPAVGAFLADVDFAAKTVTVTPPDGLIELYREG